MSGKVSLQLYILYAGSLYWFSWFFVPKVYWVPMLTAFRFYNNLSDSYGVSELAFVIRRELIEELRFILPWADWRIDCDGNGNVIAIISKIVGELSEILICLCKSTYTLIDETAWVYRKSSMEIRKRTHHLLQAAREASHTSSSVLVKTPVLSASELK